MKTRLKLNPGQKGTKALIDIYGDTLVWKRKGKRKGSGLNN